MKITLGKSVLVELLSVGGAFAGKSKTLAILDNVKMRFAKGKLYVVSSDSENIISYHRLVNDCDMPEGEYVFCVNGKDLLSYVKLVEDDTVTLDLSEEKVLKISHTDGESEFVILPVAEFPQLDMQDEFSEFEIDSALFGDWLVRAKDFLSTDTLREVMCGIYFYQKNHELGCCATDGRCLFTDSVSVSDDSEFEFILRNLPPVLSVCNNADKVKISVGKRLLMVKSGSASIATRMIQGRYPNFKAVIPKNNDIEFTTERKRLVGAISRCNSSMKVKDGVAVKFETGDKLSLTCFDADFGRKSSEKVGITPCGESKFAVAGSRILKCLNAVDGENVVINSSKDSRYAVILRSQENANRIILCMPMANAD